MDLTVQQLRCFVAVAEELSFTRAAARLDVSPSTVSEQVSGLERRLGLVLLTRTSRTVACTEAGIGLLPLARRAVAGVEAIVTWSQTGEAHPQVTIGVMSSSERFRALVTESARAMPQVDWRIRQLDFVNPFEPLRRRELDCAFVADLADAPRAEGYLSYSLWQERLVLAVRDDHDLASGTGVRMPDLTGETLICGPDGLENRSWFATIYTLIPGAPRVVPVAHNLEEVVEMCATGIGVTVVTESAMEMFPRRGLAYVPVIDAPRATMRLHVRANDPSKALAAFVAAVRARHPAGHAAVQVK